MMYCYQGAIGGEIVWKVLAAPHYTFHTNIVYSTVHVEWNIHDVYTVHCTLYIVHLEHISRNVQGMNK